MRSLDSWFDEYGESHQNPLNKLIHWICVPSIFFSIFALVASIPNELLLQLFPESLHGIAHWGTVLLFFVLAFYYAHSIPMGIGMTLFSVVCYIGLYGLQLLPMSVWSMALIIFAAAWVGQFYGHSIEGKKPSFFKDLQFLLIGPAWLMGFLFRAMGVRY
ncbi:Mpo1 family 2-hydroxy fatty acid dioxygenase [Phaeocystidibacter marisrubri]|uniref:DUF962 domain-containing protein n=1 Tax=Phaeocystidibacter marisrubri TaxID=1577780 RepID=A0A6L3ZJ46_9FLAO|nr:Mpo1-like protein [Phaeocystidibacter marisrubri]KAB2817663.1 DUF962 domain-containing protein [Phaeocystidibacter marisrubri]GGH74230.1 hypothetical protein GCM10011318_19990 [Phaeocystidibacter marisrubri]